MSTPSQQTFPTTLDGRIRDAYCVTAEFLSDIVRQSCRQLPSDEGNVKTARLERLIRSHAWTDAALTLIELKLPQWQVRRLAYDGGEWHCLLSQQRELPDWLDQPIETRHADLALAILRAFVEAKRVSAPSGRTSVSSAPQRADTLYEPIFSDNVA